MNSTQRLLAVHKGQIPDRVPISTYELVGWNRQAWENRQDSYGRLMEFIRNKTDCMYMCGVGVPNTRGGEIQSTVEKWDEDDQHVQKTVIHTPMRDLTSMGSHSDTVNTWWHREHLVKDLDDLKAYMAMPWAPGEPDFTGLKQAWTDLGDDKGLPLVSVGDPICQLAEAFEFSNFMVHAITETEAIAAALDCLHEQYRESLRRMLAGPVKNVVFRICGPEYATPPYLPPELFRRFVTRYDSEYIDMIRRAGGIPRIHSHGKTRRVLDQILEMAPAALDPIEPPPDGDIDVAEMKQAIGHKVCLTGGIELKHLEARDEAFIDNLVRKTVAAGKPGGRFILMPTACPINTLLAPQTERNYMRFIETALEVGGYV